MLVRPELSVAGSREKVQRKVAIRDDLRVPVIDLPLQGFVHCGTFGAAACTAVPAMQV